MAIEHPPPIQPDDALDRQLVTRAAGGDREAFAALVERHHARIIALLEKLCGCAEQARDLAQDVFVAAYRNLARFRGESRVSTWLHAIACNHAATDARRRRPLTGADMAAAAAREHDVSSRLEHAELSTRVQRALGRLDDRYRQVVVLSDMQGETYEEIATTLDVPIGTVRSRLHRGRLQLRSLLAADAP